MNTIRTGIAPDLTSVRPREGRCGQFGTNPMPPARIQGKPLDPPLCLPQTMSLLSDNTCQPRAYSVEDACIICAAHHRKRGGATFCFQGGILAPMPAYAVSLTRSVPVFEEVTEALLSQWIAENESRLRYSDLKLGTWHDKRTGASYIDLSLITSDFDCAAALGGQYGQYAIYDMLRGETIPLHGTTHTVMKKVACLF